MDDDLDFFYRRPLKKTRSKPKAELKSAERTSPSERSNVAGPSSEANGTDDAPIAIDDDDDEDDGDDEDIVESGSGSDYASEDGDCDAKRRVKRRKKKHTRTLPAWASQAVYRPPSLEPTPSLSAAPNSTDSPSAPSTSRDDPGPSKDTPRTARARGVSLTPPPPPSPEKLSMARELVSKVIGSKFSTARAEPARGGRQTRNSATPGAAEAGAAMVEDAEEPIRWEPDLARLMRGEDKRHLREQAKREQQEREERRRQRQPPAAAPPRANGRTRASQAVVLDGNDTDASFEELPRLSTRSPTKRSVRAKPASEPVVVEDSSSDEAPASAPAATNGGGEEQETLSLTLQSKLGSLGVTVTPTTRLATILAHFLTHHPQLTVRVDQMRATFDGYAYTAAQTIADMDVEDADQVEITWS
ncbi:uncharacterized protein PAN0_001d0377 [Moesziomyces antarcticus]|uniref:Uncharacterized protein n=1 Tax=Pseudozyma antarctica TaxID=84753 RepID=A0A5C3FF01_PSEA2|nr:uncharacterized protein PAN0_001d0377 [Moesziomyces antarcticus]GAK62179.1 conserved hypothetical protein [Moesziomyces antarcticus]SPO42716.1 uncharacterized protein PSANT_00399 [Moesziomyces antarcticus]